MPSTTKAQLRWKEIHMTTPSRPRNDLYLKGLKTTNDKRDVQTGCRFRTRLGLTDSTTPSDVRINLRYWTNASTYGLAGYSVWLFTAITTSPKMQKASQKLKVLWHEQGSGKETPLRER
ncbi:hypothetical protein PROFUN_16278 [Planoprotostelium fungivorum]|uniref:Uncharacterized protein n=1 Tax=Planoprotostelium fungivorum TaxID=1890364 RepID=A0A2P6MPH8_9EUKA|nr:hypothetical protein PROFUN_16278 [Planoprotostelium fungivorum]